MGLKPLELALAFLLFCEFDLSVQDDPVRRHHSPELKAEILRIVAEEVFEVGAEARTFDQLKVELEPIYAPSKARYDRLRGLPEARGGAPLFDVWAEAGAWNPLDRFIQQLVYPISFHGSFAMKASGFEKFIRILSVAETENPDLCRERDTSAIDPTSPLGLFVRDVWHHFEIMTYQESEAFARDLTIWCGFEPPSESTRTRPPILPPVDRRVDRGSQMEVPLDCMTMMGWESSLDKKLKAWEEYQQASTTGDMSLTQDALRRFFAYEEVKSEKSVLALSEPFDSLADGIARSSVNPHALLNLANELYKTDRLDAARAMITEAIRMCKMTRQTQCLWHCTRLLQRLDREQLAYCAEPRKGWISDHELHVLSSDLLEAVPAAIDRGERVTEALKRVDLPDTLPPSQMRSGGALYYYEDRPDLLSSLYATRSAVWDMLGYTVLADVYADTALSDLEATHETRLAVMIGRAQRVARLGAAHAAIKMLAQRDTWDGLNMREYEAWACAMWDLLEAQMKNASDSRSLRQIKGLRSPRPASHSPTQSVPEQILQAIDRVKDMLASDAPPHLMQPIAEKAYTLATATRFVSAQRMLKVLLAEILLLIPGPARLQIHRSFLPSDESILGGDDQEAIARYALVMAQVDAARWQANLSQGQRLSTSRRYIRLAVRAASKAGLADLYDRATVLDDTITRLALLSMGMNPPPHIQHEPTFLGRRPSEIAAFAKFVQTVGLHIAAGGSP